MNELALFAGGGGGILGGKLLGWRTRCAVEINPYARRILLARQRDGILDPFPIWDDITTFDGKPWKGHIDIVTGGFPCTDISTARTNNNVNGGIKGLDGAASGLWFEMLRVIKEVRPKYILIENSPNLRTKGLVSVLQGVSKLGYNARWGVLGARCFGADHHRKRMWIACNLADSNGAQFKGGGISCGIQKKHSDSISTDWWENKPRLERVANGVDNQMDRLKAIGNGQIPGVVRLAWEVLS
jgi:DNA (cytosine-5)-methyltransferase 1